MATSHGIHLYCAIGTASSETDISSYVSECGWPRKYDQGDTTTGRPVASGKGKTSIPGGVETVVPLSGKYDPALNTIMIALLAVTGKSMIYGPAGNLTGAPKYSGLGYLASYDVHSTVGDPNDWSAEFVLNTTTGTTDATF